MKTQINSVFKKISEIIDRSSDNFEISQPLLITSSLYDEIYCQKSNITACLEHQNIFSNLMKIKKKPILYGFSIDDKVINTISLREKHIEFKNLKSPRSSASYKPTLDLISKTLYVGKVKKDFHLRVVTHLGYSKNKDTAGMQLFH